MADIDDEKPDAGTVESTHTAAAGPVPAAAGDPGGDDGDLLDGSPDLDDGDLLSRAADLVAGPRRARGRPKGSPNKRNMDMVAYLAALGHRDPMVTLSMLQTSDTLALARMLGTPAVDSKGRPVLTALLDGDRKPVRDDDGELVMTLLITPEDPLKVMQLQRQAASDMLPYIYAKKPQQLELPDGNAVRPVIMIGEVNIGQGDDGFRGLLDMRPVQMEKPNEINGATVRKTNAAEGDDE